MFLWFCNMCRNVWIPRRFKIWSAPVTCGVIKDPVLRTLSSWPSISIVKRCSPSTLPSYGLSSHGLSFCGLSSPPGRLWRKSFPAVTETHGVADAHVQPEPLLQSSSFQFYHISLSCVEIWLQQNCPFHRGALCTKSVIDNRMQVDHVLQGEGLVCWMYVLPDGLVPPPLLALPEARWPGSRSVVPKTCWWALVVSGKVEVLRLFWRGQWLSVSQ